MQAVIQSLKGDLLFPLAVGKDHLEGIAVIFIAVELDEGVGAGVVIHKVLGHDGRDVIHFGLVSLTPPALGAVLDPIDLIEAAEVISIVFVGKHIQQILRHDHLLVGSPIDVGPSLDVRAAHLDLQLPLIAVGVLYRGHQRLGSQRIVQQQRRCQLLHVLSGLFILSRSLIPSGRIIPGGSLILSGRIIPGGSYILNGSLILDDGVFLRKFCRLGHCGNDPAGTDDFPRTAQRLILGNGPRVFHSHLIVLCAGRVGVGHPVFLDLCRSGDQDDQRFRAALRAAQAVQGQSTFFLAVVGTFFQIDLRFLKGKNAVRILFFPLFLGLA